MSDKEKESSLHERNNRDIMNHIFPVLSDEESYRLVIEKENIYQRLVKEGNYTLAPGLTELLNFLKKEKCPTLSPQLRENSMLILFQLSQHRGIFRH